MKLKVVRDFVNPWQGFKGGTVIEVADDFGMWLLRNKPGHFQAFKEISEPPEDKAVKSPPRSKARRSK